MKYNGVTINDDEFTHIKRFIHYTYYKGFEKIEELRNGVYKPITIEGDNRTSLYILYVNDEPEGIYNKCDNFGFFWFLNYLTYDVFSRLNLAKH